MCLSLMYSHFECNGMNYFHRALFRPCTNLCLQKKRPTLTLLFPSFSPAYARNYFQSVSVGWPIARRALRRAHKRLPLRSLQRQLMWKTCHPLPFSISFNFITSTRCAGSKIKKKRCDRWINGLTFLLMHYHAYLPVCHGSANSSPVFWNETRTCASSGPGFSFFLVFFLHMYRSTLHVNSTKIPLNSDNHRRRQPKPPTEHINNGAWLSLSPVKDGWKI